MSGSCEAALIAILIAGLHPQGRGLGFAAFASRRLRVRMTLVRPATASSMQKGERRVSAFLVVGDWTCEC